MSAQCSLCGATAPGDGLAAHILSAHVGAALTACVHCQYRNAFPDAVTHALLEGHALVERGRQRRKAQAASIIAPLREIDAASSAAKACFNRNAEERRSVNDALAWPDGLTRLRKGVVFNTVSFCGNSASELPDCVQASEGANGLLCDPENEEKMTACRDAAYNSAEGLSELKQPSEAREQSSNNSEEEASTARKECRKCNAVLQAVFPSDLAKHVRSCCSIRPFACSSCGYASARRGGVLQHIRASKSNCASALVLEVDRERCRSAEEEGMRRCFPPLTG